MRWIVNKLNGMMLMGLVALLSNPVTGQLTISQADQEHFSQKQLTPLSGPLSGQLSGSNVVIDEIIVQKDQSVTIQPGTVIMMARSSKITVKGTLRCIGDWKSQISLLPLRREDYLNPPAPQVPLKWDHIKIEPGASLELKFTRISDSRMGILFDSSAGYVSLDTVWFSNNELGNLKINEIEIPVTKEGLLPHYEYNRDVKKIVIKPHSLITAMIPPLVRYEPKVTTISVISSFVAMAAGGVVYFYNNRKYRDLAYERTELGKWGNATAANITRVKEIEMELENLKPSIRAGSIILCAGGAAFILSFPF